MRTEAAPRSCSAATSAWSVRPESTMSSTTRTSAPRSVAAMASRAPQSNATLPADTVALPSYELARVKHTWERTARSADSPRMRSAMNTKHPVSTWRETRQTARVRDPCVLARNESATHSPQAPRAICHRGPPRCRCVAARARESVVRSTRAAQCPPHGRRTNQTAIGSATGRIGPRMCVCGAAQREARRCGLSRAFPPCHAPDPARDLLAAEEHVLDVVVQMQSGSHGDRPARPWTITAVCAARRGRRPPAFGDSRPFLPDADRA